MKKCELLSPAGNMEMLKYAIAYGADAVYLAGTRFGARKYADNFTESDLEKAIEYAHLYGVKVYITINTLIFENEVQDFIEYVKLIHKLGVDAVLVQDFGMLNLIRKVMPNLELHASTQMHNNGKNMLTLLKNKGVKRAVLDRELSLKEIENFKVDIEKEVFVHGALCVSYSGQCLFSSHILNRSGNRGACAGMCRLPYSIKNDKRKLFYLSLKDLCTVNRIDKILDYDIESIKIEGRMKSPHYVGYLTKIYRKQIDSYYEGKYKKIDKEEMKNISLLFNRGFTEGFIFDAENSSIVNRESPNHIGIHLGTYEARKNKIKLILKENLNQFDTIRFKEAQKGMTVNFLYDKNNNLVKEGKCNETIFLDNFLDIEGSGELRKTGSFLLNKSIEDLPQRKVKIFGEVEIKSNKNVKLKVTDGVNEIVKYGVKPEAAKTVPLNIETVEKQLKKTGSTIFEFKELKIDLEAGIFLNIQDLNKLRRESLENLASLRSKNKKEVIIKDIVKQKQKKQKKEIELNVIVQNEEQFHIAIKYANKVFSSNTALTKNFKNIIYPKYSENEENINTEICLISDLGSLQSINHISSIHSDYMLNVVNSYTVEELKELSVSTICLSPEINFSDIRKITENTDPSYLEILIYGKLELMKMKFNPLGPEENDYLIDRNGEKYSIKKSKHMNYLMSPHPVNKITEIDDLIALGITNFRVDLFDENVEETENLLKTIHKKLFKE